MYENLTSFIPRLQNEQIGILSYEYADTVYQFVDTHESMGLNRYGEILEKSGIKWASGPMLKADVTNLDGETVMALIVGILRADRFSEGIFKEFLENGCMSKWLERLKQIDENN